MKNSQKLIADRVVDQMMISEFNNYFSLDNTQSIWSLNNNAKIHLIGVCGVAMGALALALSDSGFEVSGSDKEFYPPMSEMLKQSKVQVYYDYDSNNIKDNIDLVVVGNSVPSSNIEVQAVFEKKIAHTFFSKALGELLLEGKKSIVVSGTHGKTTTTAIISYGLERLGLAPSYFVGGQVPQLPTTLTVGKGQYGVVEGDEYDSVFYVKRPKFIFYKPDILVINAIEFDHADIYSDLSAIEKEFTELIGLVPSNGVIIACSDFSTVNKLILDAKKLYPNKKYITFGISEADAKIMKVDYLSDKMIVDVQIYKERLSFKSSLSGIMNARNMLAALLVIRELDISVNDWISAVEDFKGASRRLEVRAATDKFLILEDFAHHPTAVKETIGTIKSKYPSSECWVAFEPRSNTSRRDVLQEEYNNSFFGVNRLYLRDITKRPSDEGQGLLDLNKISAIVNASQAKAFVMPTGQEIATDIINNLRQIGSDKHVVVVIMSNGSFDGLPAALSKF